MRAMKDSGIQWLGDIPESWGTLRLKRIFSIKKDIAGEEGHTVLSVTQRGIRPKVMSEKGQFAQDYSKYQLVYKGEFVMNHMDLLTGWVDISNYNGVTSPDYRVFINTNSSKYDSGYYRYIFQLCYSARIFYGLGKGVAGFGRWRLPADMFLNFVLPVPDFEEQKRIAEFLDVKCTEIDALIADVQAQIDVLEQYKRSVITETVTKGLNPDAEMKDSGIEWIKQIPISWGLQKLKYLTTKCERGTSPDYTDEVTTMVVNQATFSRGYFDTSNIRYSTKPAATSRGLLKKGDVLLASTGGGVLGKTFYFDEDETYVADGHVTVIRTKPVLHSKYLYYYFFVNFDMFNSQMAEGSTNQTELQRDLLGEMFVPLPPLEEQDAIVSELDAKVSEIDGIIDQKKEQLEVLDSYKKSLIYEYVTGKKSVPFFKIV